MEYLRVLGVVLLMTSWTACYEMAKLYNSHGTVTSSTLAWTPVRPGQDLPLNAVTLSTDGLPWCRAREHAVWVAGEVRDGRCHAPFPGNIVNTETFQVLVSMNGSARLVNVRWDTLVAYPPNVVSTEDMLLAVSFANGLAPMPGFVDPQERRALFLKDNESIKSEEGFLLTEVEPIAYRLTEVRLSNRTERHLQEKVLSEFTFENPDEVPIELTRDVNFIAPHAVYFGKMKGSFVNLPTTVSGPDVFPTTIRWGIRNELDRNISHTIRHELPGRSSVRVRLVAVIRNLDGSYSGQLASIYEDGVELERTIAGVYTERKLAELHADFDQTVSIYDRSPLRQWPPNKKILLHSTTTTPAPPGIPGSSSNNQLLPKPQGVGVGAAQQLPTNLWVALPIFVWTLLRW